MYLFILFIQQNSVAFNDKFNFSLVICYNAFEYFINLFSTPQNYYMFVIINNFKVTQLNNLWFELIQCS